MAVPGPVFVYEAVAAARRRQGYLLRAGFVAALLAGLALTWLTTIPGPNGPVRQTTIQAMAQIGQSFYYVIATLQIAVVLVAAPAATAGAVCLDRSRGALAEMLATELTSAEVAVGKLGARLLPVLAAILASWPVLAIASLLGGVPPFALVTLVLVSAGVALLGGSFALSLSARVGKAHEVLLVVYGAWFVWNIGLLVWNIVTPSPWVPPPPPWFEYLNPFVLAWAPYQPAAALSWALPVFLAVCVVLSALLTFDAARQLRREPVAGRRWRVGRALSAVPRPRLPRWRGPSLDTNPILWREWHRNRPSRAVRWVWAVYVLVTVLALALGLLEVATTTGRASQPNLSLYVGFMAWFGMLIVSVTAPAALTEERVRGSLDVLMSTPLPTPLIVLGKWWGAFRLVPRVAFLPAIAGVVMAVTAPTVNPARVLAVMPPGATGVVMPPMPPPAMPLGVLDRVAGAVAPGALLLAQGAAVAGFGLLLATWSRRPGRAMAVSAGLYVVVSAGSVFALELGVIDALLSTVGVRTQGADESLTMVLFSLEPLGACMAAPSVLYESYYGPRAFFWAAEAVALVATGGLALTFLGLTLATFDRCLGRARVTEGPPPVSRRHRRARLTPAPHSPRYASSSSPLM